MQPLKLSYPNDLIKIGIWGLGTVGKSALRYFQKQGYQVQLFDDGKFHQYELTKIERMGTTLIKNRNLFLQTNDFILPSPGIDLRPYKKWKKKWLAELDIIQQQFTKPVVAITGTNGKTTITHLLSELLKAQGLRVWTGGNIGAGMLDLLEEKNNIDLAVLEVSSFQLEICKCFAPTLAIWTTFSENHLDRHGTLETYFAAKKKIIDNQTKNQHAILPLSLVDKKLDNILSQIHFFTNKCLSNPLLEKFESESELMYIKKREVMRHKINLPPQKTRNTNFLLQNLPPITFQENLLILAMATNIICRWFDKRDLVVPKKLSLPPHRLEKIATINGVDFYNDSKATTPSSTIAAVRQLSSRPILIFLGGLSKGTDRVKLVEKIKKNIKKVYAFGAEAKEIALAAQKACVPCQQFSTLDEAVKQSITEAHPQDQILLSPGGSSFDLFKNYKDRGETFKKLILSF